KPDLAMPWPAWYELEGELPATVALAVAPSVLPSQLPLYMQDLRGHEGHNLSLSLQLLDIDQYGRDMQIRDLAQRVIYALSAAATPLLKPKAPGAAVSDGKVQLDVGPMPIFLIDIDGPLAQLRASVAFDRPLLESSFEPHSRHIRFVNPYKQAISGSLKLK